MSRATCVGVLGSLSFLASLGFNAHAQQIKKVFVIAMENHNWTQPDYQFAGGIQQIYQNANAPFINSLVNGTAQVTIGNHSVSIGDQVAYAAAYHNVLATATGNNAHIHPSEPNYLWSEAGTNFGIFNDADPYPSNIQNTTQHLTGLMQQAGLSWKSYQEDIDLQPDNGTLLNIVRPVSEWTVPLTSFSGFFDGNTTNQWNGSAQYNYATKHNPMAFFTDTNGGGDPTSANPMAAHYAPLQQLAADLENNTVADYNWITPDQYNDMHTALKNGYEGLTGDAANIKQGDDFLRDIVPMIMASKAYQDNGVIILWWDEAESDRTGDNADDFNHTVPEIIISKHVHKNVNGAPYASTVNLTHSSDLRTMEEIFHLSPMLGDAANATDLSDLFQPGAITGAEQGNK